MSTLIHIIWIYVSSLMQEKPSFKDFKQVSAKKALEALKTELST